MSEVQGVFETFIQRGLINWLPTYKSWTSLAFASIFAVWRSSQALPVKSQVLSDTFVAESLVVCVRPERGVRFVRPPPTRGVRADMADELG